VQKAVVQLVRVHWSLVAEPLAEEECLPPPLLVLPAGRVEAVRHQVDRVQAPPHPEGLQVADRADQELQDHRVALAAGRAQVGPHLADQHRGDHVQAHLAVAHLEVALLQVELPQVQPREVPEAVVRAVALHQAGRPQRRQEVAVLAEGLLLVAQMGVDLWVDPLTEHLVGQKEAVL